MFMCYNKESYLAELLRIGKLSFNLTNYLMFCLNKNLQFVHELKAELKTFIFIVKIKCFWFLFSFTHHHTNILLCSFPLTAESRKRESVGFNFNLIFVSISIFVSTLQNDTVFRGKSFFKTINFWINTYHHQLKSLRIELNLLTKD